MKKKGKEAESKYHKSKYCQTLRNNHVETAILQSNANYTTVNFKSVMTIIQNTLNTLLTLDTKWPSIIYVFRRGKYAALYGGSESLRSVY